jgi:pimeloyl-ACP methyl ester carboxylesterase
MGDAEADPGQGATRPEGAGRSPDFVGRARLLPGEGFALRSGIWRWALRAASEDRRRPVGIGVRGGGGAQLVSRFYDVGAGRRLHARVSVARGRSTTPVVLVHGLIVSSRYLMPTAVELAADFPVLVPDLPGYGSSDAPAGRALDLTALADAVIACARADGHECVSLVGNSFGAQIVVEAALRHPEHVDRVVLLGPTVDPAARGLIRQSVRWLRNAPDEHLSAVPIMARDLADVGPWRAAHLLRVMLGDRVEEKLPHVHCPALVVRAGRDRVVPSEWALRVAALLPRGELAVLPGYAHMAHYSGPLALVPLLRPFLLARARSSAMSGPFASA